MTWLTLVFLFSITLIPFATNLVISYGQYQIVFALYALVLTVVGALLTIMWLHAIKNKFIDENLTRIEIHGILLQSIHSPVVFLDLAIAYYFWLVLMSTRLASTKFALEGLSEALQYEVDQFGIKVMLIPL
jgi:uncharacterized membrane protein